MTNEGVLDFVATLCATGEAGRYGERNAEVAAERFASERDGDWEDTVDASDADYSRLFLTRADTRVVRRPRVSLHEVLDGLSPTDTRLRDEILGLLGEA